jgi:hypothetical protein
MTYSKGRAMFPENGSADSRRQKKNFYKRQRGANERQPKVHCSMVKVSKSDHTSK